MSRIFRRPMFRKGGGANMNGIMSGIEDRQNYAEAGRVGELTKENLDILMQNAPQDKGFDPLTTFLLQYGPSIASQAPQGKGLSGLISTGLAAAEKPVANLLENQAERRKYLRDLKSGAAQLAIEQAGKEKLLADELSGKLKIAETTASGKMDPLYASVLDTNIQEYGADNIPAAQAATKFQTELAGDFRKKVGSRAGGVLTFDINDVDQRRANEKLLRKNKGKVFYDPFTNTYVKVQEVAGVLGFDTYNTIEEIDLTEKITPPPEKKDRSVPDFGMSMDDPSA